MSRSQTAALTGALVAAVSGTVAVTQLGGAPATRAIGTAATLTAPRGATGQHGPNGEPCYRVLTVTGKRDPALTKVVTTTVKVPKGTIVYTQTTYVIRWQDGTKPPPTVTTEHVCAYQPKAPA